MHSLFVGGLSLTVTGVLVPLALGDPTAGAEALVALALWLGAALLALLLWARSAPPRPALLFSGPVCRPSVPSPRTLPVEVRCYDESGAMTFLIAELIPPAAV